MNNNKVRISIEEEEWEELDPAKRQRILELMDEYGYDTVALKALEKQIGEQTIEDIYRQFYGEEEE
jgi:predicted Fe-Mo cluster-binding NifX family protein